MSEIEELPEDGGEEKPQKSSAQAAAKEAKGGQAESRHYSVISQTMSDGRIMIGADLQLFPDRECKEFASPGTRAFNAKDRKLPGEQFVLLAGRSSIPRVTMIGSYKNFKNPHILKLIDAGLVDWTPENRQRLGLIFDKPPGRKVLTAPDAQPFQLPEERLIQAVIQPAVSVLTDLKNIDFTHGAIHPENMFLVGREGSEMLMLGECLSSAAFSWQHPLFEVVSRATARATGRGSGTAKDDLYALGVCVVMIASGKNLMIGRTKEQLIYDKIEHGSYAAIMGELRVPGGVAEFLRGVLNDDEDQRWDIDDVQRWLEGRRQSPKQSRPILKASRLLVFHGQKFWDLRSIAEALSENMAEASAEVEKGQFVLWVKRSFDDKNLKLRFDKVWEKEKVWSRERFMTGICMALDPFGPVRYKGLALFPSGFGTALAVAMSNSEDIQVYAEVIAQQLFAAWIAQITEEVQDAAGVTSLFEKCRSALTQRMPGYGMERVLYMLNPEVACLSPALRKFFVLVPGSLLLTLEVIAQEPERPAAVLDRHMIAFISVREPKAIDAQLSYLNSTLKGNQVLGFIRTLAGIQRRYSIGSVPNVGNWLISMTPPLIEMLNDRDLRQLMTKHVNKLADSGNLSAILDIVDDRPLVQDDAQRFTLALHEYARLSQEKHDIEENLKKRRTFGRSMGRQVAMIFSSIISAIVMGGYIVIRLTKGF